MSDKPRLNVGLVGYAFMGKAHSEGWRTAPVFFDLPYRVGLTAVCGRDGVRAAQAASQFGWASWETDWRALIARDDVDLIDICTPGDSHAEIAIAALAAGKHVLCEKPLANTVAEAEAMAEAAAEAAKRGVYAMVGFTNRRVPAIALARRMIEAGRLGAIRQVRAAYQQDWLVDPGVPLAWRLQKDRAGSGALGDIGAHIVDLAQFLVGDDLTAVSGTVETFIASRPLQAGGGGLAGTAGEGFGEVTVDDAAWFLGRFGSGAMASFEATRYATGRKNALSIEVSGSEGALIWNLEELNVLHFYDNRLPAVEAGFARILATEADTPYYAAWWPAGHTIGWEHGFTHQVLDLVTAIAAGVQPRPSFTDGLQVQRVLDAVERSSAASTAWVQV
ncbi:MAG: Gfo/Idh/MocA family oxidoreductase [Propionibacteriaceae bacterium]|jgi:predicted dehydrogenase|nr:Gfo/Idh/MocA family oxidoreductase [Propionibacteriaceae bacterium]